MSSARLSIPHLTPEQALSRAVSTPLPVMPKKSAKKQGKKK